MSKNAKVTKIVLIQELATSLGVSKAQAEKFLSAFIDVISFPFCKLVVIKSIKADKNFSAWALETPKEVANS